jgi:multiple sugar transport system substrate-binding protein
MAQNTVTFWAMLGERSSQEASAELLRSHVSHALDTLFISSNESDLFRYQIAILQLIDEFEHSYNSSRIPNDQINIKIQFLSWKLVSKALDWAVENDAARPDIVQMPSTWTANYVSKHMLYSVGDLARDTNAYIRYPRATLDSCFPEGKSDGPYALPWTLDCRVYYYYVDDFRQAGYDAARIKRAFTDLERLKIACRDLKARGLSKPVLGITTAEDWGLIHDAAPWIWRRGGAYVRSCAEGWESGLADQSTRDGLWDYIDLAMEFSELPVDSQSAKTAEGIDDNFFKRNAYSLISSGQRIKSHIYNLPNLGGNRVGTVAPYFCDKRTPLTFLGGCHLSLVYRKNQSRIARSGARALLLDLAANTTTQVRYADQTGYMPALKEAFREYAKKDPLHELYRASLDAIDFNQKEYYPSVAQWKEIEEILKSTLNKVWIEAGKAMAAPPVSGKTPKDIAAPGINRILDNYTSAIFEAEERR